jgi:uncharacterized membrane protein
MNVDSNKRADRKFIDTKKEIVLGTGIGIILGAAFGNPGVGLVIGAGVGLALGAASERRGKE